MATDFSPLPQHCLAKAARNRVESSEKTEAMLEGRETFSPPQHQQPQVQLRCSPPHPQQPQGPPTQHLQLQAQLQGFPTQLQQLQVPPAPTYLEPQGSRAQPTALLHHGTEYKEDLCLITITEDPQPKGPGQPQLQQLQAQLKCPPPGLRRLGLLLSRTSSQKICAPGRSSCPPPHPMACGHS